MTTPTPPADPTPNQPVAGWYPDHNAGQLRYWDGNAWTEHLTPYPAGDPGAPPPPSAVDVIASAAVAPGVTASTDRLPPLNQWISETFRLVIDQAGHIFTLIVVLTFAVDLIAAGLTWYAVQDVVVTVTDGASITVDGATVWIAFAALASIVSIATKVALAASSARHVLAARTGVPESWSDTLRETVARLPRVVGAILAFFGSFVVLYIAVVIPLGLVTAVAPIVGLLALLVAFLGIVAGLARIGFGPVMSMIAPVGQGGIRRSISLTKGLTLVLVRRLAMLAMIGFTMLFITSLFTAPLLGGSGELVANGDVVNLGDVVGDNAAAFGIGQIISGLVAGLFAALVGGGLGLIYADLGGPIEPTITDVDPTGMAPTPSS